MHMTSDRVQTGQKNRRIADKVSLLNLTRVMMKKLKPLLLDSQFMTNKEEMNKVLLINGCKRKRVTGMIKYLLGV